MSQILALASANRLDHYIKETLRIRGYGRYMDAGGEFVDWIYENVRNVDMYFRT